MNSEHELNFSYFENILSIEKEEIINCIHAETYGTCEKTGKKIPIARLLANPTARTLVSD